MRGSKRIMSVTVSDIEEGYETTLVQEGLGQTMI